MKLFLIIFAAVVLAIGVCIAVMAGGAGYVAVQVAKEELVAQQHALDQKQVALLVTYWPDSDRAARLELLSNTRKLMGTNLTRWPLTVAKHNELMEQLKSER